MSTISINDQKIGTYAISSSVVFLILGILFFSPFELPFKLAYPLLLLTVVSLWLCPWQITLALMMSTAGDVSGSAGLLIPQIIAFSGAHVLYICYFVKRYLDKVEHDRKLTMKAKGYLAMVTLCIICLIAICMTKFIPAAPAGTLRFAVTIYILIISAMLGCALIQRSSLFAIGAILFVFSDFILAWTLFIEPIQNQTYLIMIPYYLGQWLLFIRSTKYRVKKEIRLLRF